MLKRIDFKRLTPPPVVNIIAIYSFLLLSSTLLLACSNEHTPTTLPTTTPTATHTPTATATLPPTPRPTATPHPIPTATATPLPTHTPLPTPTPASSPTPEPFIEIDPETNSPSITIGDTTFDLEIAFTPETRTQGLSDRESLPQTTGMLFVFEQPLKPSFWMYHMKFDLDFVWISQDCVVADIHQNVPRQGDEQSANELPHYRPKTPVLYNLEINAGLTETLSIEIGDKVTFNGFTGTGAVCR